MNELAINLMRLRKLNSLTQQDVADAAGISRVAYRNLEKGDAEPRQGTLHSLAKALNRFLYRTVLLWPIWRLNTAPPAGFSRSTRKA